MKNSDILYIYFMLGKRGVIGCAAVSNLWNLPGIEEKRCARCSYWVWRRTTRFPKGIRWFNSFI